MEEKFLNLAEKLLTKNGFNIEISEKIKGEFNVDLGDYEFTYNIFNGLAIYLSLEEGDFINKSYNTDNIKNSLLIFSKEKEIDISCLISFGGEQYSILEIKKVKAKNQTIIYKVLVG